MQDVPAVFEIQEPFLEQEYLQRWADVLGVADLFAQVRQQAARPPQTQR